VSDAVRDPSPARESRGIVERSEAFAPGLPASAQGGIAGVAIQGSLEEASLPDVVQLLALGQKTGCLSLTEGTLQGEIYLDDGRICYAFVASRRDRIGDMLVRSGRITRQQLSAAIAEHQSGSSKRVSEILLASGQVQRSELLQFMQRQVEEAVYFMFTWRTGAFLFRSRVRPEEQTLLVSIDPEALLLEGARRVDEWSVIEKKISSFDLVYRLNRSHLEVAAVELTDEQRHIVPLIDGARDVAGIIELAGLSEFDVGKALYGLITAGFAQVVERRTVARHLDYRELLAYVVREAEYADPEQRRAAARHIADCTHCSERLKTIHVRRTGAMPATAPTQAAPAPSVLPPPPIPHATPPEEAERRHQDRRSGEERRARERRSGERRRTRSAEWERPGVDRRSGSDRRHVERRASERRLTAAGGAAGHAAMATGAPLGRAAGSAHRTTGPRRIPPAESGRAGRSTARHRTRAGSPRQSAPPPAKTATPPETAPPAAAAPQPTPEAKPRRAPATPVEIPDLPEAAASAETSAETSTPATDPSAAEQGARPLPASVTRHPRPEALRPGNRSKDIQWLVSPDEADTLLRTSHAVGSPAAKPAPEKETTAPPATAKPAATVEPLVTPPVPAGAPAPVASPSVVHPAPAPAPAVEPSAARTPAPAAAPRPAAVPATTPQTRRAPNAVRWIGIAAAVVSLVGVGWLGRTLLPGGETAVPTSAAEPAPAETPQATITPAPTEPTPVRPAPAPVTVRQEPSTPAPRQTAPAGSRAERPVQRESVTVPPPATVAAPVQPTPDRATEQPAAAAVPVVGTIRGTVRDAASGAALAGVHVTIPGTTFEATTDAGGEYTIPDVSRGSMSVVVTAGNRPPMTREVVVQAETPLQVDFLLPAPPPPVASDADEELAAGGWVTSNLANAAETLGIPLAVIPGMFVESIATPESGSRPRVRIAQLTSSGQRIVLTETRSGAPVSGGTPRVTALRIIPASQTYPLTTGTASFGNLLVTAKAALPGDSLRTLLATLVVAQPSR